MNSSGKFLVSALLIHAANLKKLGDTQTTIPVPHTATPIPVSVPVNTIAAQPQASGK
jgi:hypothetical protein